MTILERADAELALAKATKASAQESIRLAAASAVIARACFESLVRSQ